VRTDLLELGTIEERALRSAAIARPASETPSGLGVGAGRLTALQAMDGPPIGGEAIAVVGREDFEVAAALLRNARER
jgi:hypothetical protein